MYADCPTNKYATLSGVETAYRVLKKKGRLGEKDTYKFITFGGDGGTYDIGFQSLSGAMERGHDLVYVCYDNGAYMNTGLQNIIHCIPFMTQFLSIISIQKTLLSYY